MGTIRASVPSELTSQTRVPFRRLADDGRAMQRVKQTGFYCSANVARRSSIMKASQKLATLSLCASSLFGTCGPSFGQAPAEPKGRDLVISTINSYRGVNAVTGKLTTTARWTDDFLALNATDAFKSVSPRPEYVDFTFAGDQ